MSRDVFRRYELPPEWQWKKLGDICDIADRDHRTPTYQDDGVPLISPKDFTEHGIDLSRLKHVASFELDAFRKKCKPAKGDILYSRIGTVGEARLIDFDLDFVALHSIAMVKPRMPGLLSKYVLYLLKTPSVRTQAKHNIKSVGTPDLGLKRIKDFDVPIAPIDLQPSIVAEIEKQFSRLDEAVAGLKRIKANLKRYKAAVLKAAVEGRLVPTEADLARREGRDFETGAQLLQRILTTRRSQLQGKGKYKEPVAPDITDLPELPEGWVWASIDELANVVRGGSPRPAGDPRYFGGPVPWITVGPITADESDYLHRVPEGLTFEGKERSRFIEPETLLLTNSGATLGVPKISLIGGCINDGVAALLDVGYPLKQYLLKFLRTKTMSLRQINQGAAQPNLNTSIIKAMVVPLPPSAEQHRIVAEVDRLLSIAREVEAEVDANLKRAQSLRQAILSKSFSPT